MDVAELMGYVGGALLVARLIPQLRHVRRTGSSSGVSRAGLWCWLGNDAAWLSYSLSEGLAPVVVSSVALLALDMALLREVRAFARPVRADAPGVVYAAVLVALAASASSLLPVLLLASSVSGTVPHAVAAVRASDLSGVSSASWRLAALDGLLWTVYGASVPDVPVLAHALLTLAAATVILVRLRSAGHESRRVSPALPGAPAPA